MHIGKMSLISIIIHGYFNCTLFKFFFYFFYRNLTVLQSRCVQHILNNLDEMAFMTMLKKAWVIYDFFCIIPDIQ